MEVLERLQKAGIIPVAVIEDAKDAVPLAEALLAGGADTIEVTFRTGAAAEAIRLITGACPDLLVGAGTVLTRDQCREAVRCGAKYIVSPGYSEDLVTWALQHGTTVIPGCLTPSEIMAAVGRDISVVKFFPAEASGGIPALKALAGPFGDLGFIPTGGVDADNLREYYALPCVRAVGGSWMCTKEDIAARRFDRITQLTREAMEEIADLRK